MWCVHVYGVRLRLFEFILPQSSLNGLRNGEADFTKEE